MEFIVLGILLLCGVSVKTIGIVAICLGVTNVVCRMISDKKIKL